jgi:hypothetical protein
LCFQPVLDTLQAADPSARLLAQADDLAIVSFGTLFNHQSLMNTFHQETASSGLSINWTKTVSFRVLNAKLYQLESLEPFARADTKYLVTYITETPELYVRDIIKSDLQKIYLFDIKSSLKFKTALLFLQPSWHYLLIMSELSP